MPVLERLEAVEAQKIKQAFIALLTAYMQPAFGSMSKRDFDILLFMKLQELGAIDVNPEIYDLVSDLRVARTKARNLLYEAKLRANTREDLDRELIVLLKNPIFLKDNDKIAMEVDNPYLIDHLRSHLRKLGHITDGSFSQELIKLTPDAFISLFDAFVPAGRKEEIRLALVHAGAIEDTSFKAVFKGVLKKLGTKVADDAGGALAESIGDYLGPVLSGAVDTITEKFTGLLGGEN